MKVKKKLEAVIEALIKGDSEEAEKALHEALTAKLRALVEGDDEKCDDCGKDPCECKKDDDKDSDDDKDDDKAGDDKPPKKRTNAPDPLKPGGGTGSASDANDVVSGDSFTEFEAKRNKEEARRNA